MSGARRRWAVSEGSLLPTVGGNLGTKRIQRGGEVRGERERTDKGGGGGVPGKGGGEGSGKFAREKEGIRRRDLGEAGECVRSHGEEYCGETTNGLAQ